MEHCKFPLSEGSWTTGGEAARVNLSTPGRPMPCRAGRLAVLLSATLREGCSDYHMFIGDEHIEFLNMCFYG